MQGINFYANDGFGHFEFQHAIFSSTDHFRQFSLGDLNCDDRTDLLIAQTQMHKISWIENIGEGAFSPPVDLHLQDPELIMAVELGDLDSNGNADPVWGNKTLGARLNECLFSSIKTPHQSEPLWQVYPNPVFPGQPITIEWQNMDTPTTIVLSDWTGRILDAQDSWEEQAEIQMPSVPGAYLLRIQSAKQNLIKMVVIQ